MGLRPAEVALRLAVNGLVGGAVLWVFNYLTSPLGFHLGLNPISALIVGLLGLPGLVGLSLLRLFLA